LLLGFSGSSAKRMCEEKMGFHTVNFQPTITVTFKKKEPPNQNEAPKPEWEQSTCAELRT